MEELYTMQAPETSSEGYSFRKNYLEVKAAIPLSRYIEDTGVTELRREGVRLIGLCPLHAERTPSFTLFGNSRYYCFGCGASGDVIKLHAHLDHHSSQWTAMQDLAERYKVALSEKPEKWYRWQTEKHAVKDLAENIRFQSRCRRIFKVLILNAPEIQGIEDSDERREEIARCWEAFQEGMRRVCQ